VDLVALSIGAHSVQVYVYNTSWQMSTYTWSFDVDTTMPPELIGPTPAPGSTVATRFPTVSAAASGELSAYQAYLDGAPIPTALEGAVVSGTPATPIANDRSHTATIDVTSTAGLSNSLSWDFYVQIHPKMPDTVGDDCTACHTDQPTAHPMDDCVQCHGPGSPYTLGWEHYLPGGHVPADRAWLSDCTWCHGSVYPSIPALHTSPPEDPYHDSGEAGCIECHQRSLTIEHHLRDNGLDCLTCHASGDPDVAAAVEAGDTDCSACHTLGPDHGFDPLKHTADVAADTVSGTWPAPGDSPTYNPPYAYVAACGDCHEMLVTDEHEKPGSSAEGLYCSACHPTPRNTFTTWDRTCEQGGCHPAGSPTEMHTELVLRHAMGTENVDGGCGFIRNGQLTCHYRDLVQEHNRTILLQEEPQIFRHLAVSCTECHQSAEYASQAGAWDGRCQSCHLESHMATGTPRADDVYDRHDNPSGYYDNGLGNVGDNAMDAHGWVRNHPTNPRFALGCAAITCHTAAYIGGGYPVYSAACMECHGPSIVRPEPYAGTYMWYSGQGVDYTPLEHTLTLDALLLPASSAVEFMTWYDIEDGWDYGYVEVSTDGGSNWTPLAGDITTTDDPNGSNDGDGVTGSTGGAWVAASFDVSAYGGQSVRIRFRYTCDSYVYGVGWCVDELTIGPAGSPVFSDGAESLDPAWTVGGWERSTGS
jgi:hypothetical protein